MDEFIKMLANALKEDGAKVEVHKMNKDEFDKVFDDKNTKKVDEMAEIAHINRKLYEAHIKEGFTSEEALALTVAVIQ